MKSSLVFCLKPFPDMMEFLEDDSGFNTSKNCRNLCQVFGKGFTDKSVVILIIIIKRK